VQMWPSLEVESPCFMPQGLVEAGPEGKVSGSWTICDVRDVAAAHIKAAEDPAVP
jgi:hypothetical protein